MTPFYLGIPTLRCYDACRECLDSAFSGSVRPTMAFVVDNGGSFIYNHPKVRIIRPPDNLGVARSWNLLHKLTYPTPLVLSNDDVAFYERSLEIALATEGAFVTLNPVPGEPYSCFLIRNECWTKVGDFDETFWPAYYEDNDHHYRMKLAGLSIVDLPSSHVLHHGSATTKALPPIHQQTVQRRSEENKRYFVEKWGGLPGEERFLTPFGM